MSIANVGAKPTPRKAADSLQERARRKAQAKTSAKIEADVGKGQKNKSRDEREEFLLSHPWAQNVQLKSVDCKMCGRVIRLENRGDFYPFNWIKHTKTHIDSGLVSLFSCLIVVAS